MIGSEMQEPDKVNGVKLELVTINKSVSEWSSDVQVTIVFDGVSCRDGILLDMFYRPQVPAAQFNKKLKGIGDKCPTIRKNWDKEFRTEMQGVKSEKLRSEVKGTCEKL